MWMGVGGGDVWAARCQGVRGEGVGCGGLEKERGGLWYKVCWTLGEGRAMPRAWRRWVRAQGLCLERALVHTSTNGAGQLDRRQADFCAKVVHHDHDSSPGLYNEMQKWYSLRWFIVLIVAGARSTRIPAYQKLSRADATGTPATVGPRRVQGEVPRCNRGHRDHLEKPGR